MQYENLKYKFLIRSNTNFNAGNVQLSVGKLQLSAPTCLAHDVVDLYTVVMTFHSAGKWP